MVHASHEDASRGCEQLRKQRLARWASMGTACHKEQADSETNSDVETGSEDSDIMGLSVMSAVFASGNHAVFASQRNNQEGRTIESPNPEECVQRLCEDSSEKSRLAPCVPDSSCSLLPEASAFLRHAVGTVEMEERMQRLTRYVWKYPVDGGKWFATAKERYFSIVLPVSWNPKGNRWLQSFLAFLQEPSLCYWIDQGSSIKKQPLGVIPIASITAVTHNSEEYHGLLVKIKTASKIRYCQTSKANVAKNGDFVLTLRFSSASEAESWVSDFKAFVRCEGSTQTK